MDSIAITDVEVDSSIVSNTLWEYPSVCPNLSIIETNDNYIAQITEIVDSDPNDPSNDILVSENFDEKWKSYVKLDENEENISLNVISDLFVYSIVTTGLIIRHRIHRSQIYGQDDDCGDFFVGETPTLLLDVVVWRAKHEPPDIYIYVLST